MKALREAVATLRAVLNTGAASDKKPSVDVQFDDGNVQLKFVAAGGDRTVVSVIFTDADAYPDSPVVLWSECGASDKVEALERAAETQFQHRATLTKIIEAVGKVFGVDLLPPAVPSGPPPNSADVAALGGEGRSGGRPDRAASTPGGSCRAMSVDGDEDGGGSQEDDEAGRHDDSDDDGMSGGSGGGEDEALDDQDDDESDDDEDEREMLYACGKRQARWERHEEALAEATKLAEGATPGAAAAAAASSAAALSQAQRNAMKLQIFEPREALTMLSKELLACVRNHGQDMFVDTVGDDIYHWSVEVASFNPSSPLAKDMAEVSRRYQYGTVKLHVSFMRGLHPFYPASVEIVRPHFQGAMLAAVASHPMLRLENWDPWRPLADLIFQIKTFLESTARVDMEHPMNDISRHPSSCYTGTERMLARLEALSGLTPLSHEQFADMYSARDGYAKDEARLSALMDQSGSKNKRTRTAEDEAKAPQDGLALTMLLGGASEKPADKDASTKKTGTQSKVAAPPPKAWAAGTGYGSGHGEASGSGKVWDPRAADLAQRARDDELQAVIEGLTAAIAVDSGRPLDASSVQPSSRPSTSAAATAATTSMDVDVAAAQAAPASSRATAGPAAAVVGPAAAVAAGDFESCLTALEGSVLVPFLLRELTRVAFSEMCSRALYYTGLMKLVQQICVVAGGRARGMVTRQQEVHSVQSLLGLVRHSAQSYTKLIEPIREAVRKEEMDLAAAKAAGTVLPPSSLSTHNALKEAQSSLLLSDALAEADKALNEAVAAGGGSSSGVGGGGGTSDVGGGVGSSHSATAARLPPGPSSSRTGGSGGVGVPPAVTAAASGTEAGCSSSAASGSGGASAATDYCATMRPMQVASCSGFKDNKHTYAKELSTESSGAGSLKPRMIRIAKELSGLEALLPLNESSSVFVRFDEAHCMLWKALITGPEDTPYSGGCFVFDIYFPSTYPNSPPMVQLLTTGGGTVRFNPNLYNCGKVCLSLLGTWQGSKGESWTPDVSSLLQVLVSIQSLILVPDPYFNEPGYERTMHTPEGIKASRDYNKVIREGCLRYAMVDILKHPPAEFADVVRTHFAKRGDAILVSTQKWVEEGKAFCSTHSSKLDAMRTQLAKLLRELKV